MSNPWRELLPTSVEVSGKIYEIRSDYRAALDICVALSDPELSDQDRGVVVLDIFYPDFSNMPVEDYNEAIQKCFWFINCGAEETQQKAPRLVDWEKDFPYIVAPINRVLGQEIRAIPYDMETNTGGLHWWTFIGAYNEIGDCLFAQIIRIRSMKARGKKLDKSDQEWYRQNRHLVDFKQTFTESENDELSRWGAK